MIEKYITPDIPHIKVILSSFETEIDDFLFYFRGYSKSTLKYEVCGLDFIDVIIRVDKRLKYFEYFHAGMDINECKEAALYAYWINKFKPIRIVDKKYLNEKDSIDVNELFAIHYMLGAIRGMGKITKEISLDNNFFKELRYSFRFRNFTIDSLIVLADAINDSSFEDSLIH